MRLYKKSNKFSNKKVLLGSIFLIIILIAGTWFIVHQNNIRQAQKTSGKIPTSKKDSASDKNTADKSEKSSDVDSEINTKLPGNSASQAPANLDAPFGNFVSNHAPGKNGSPKTIQSVCNTTPGATCDIVFKNKEGTSKNLGATKVDSSGVAFWTWSVDGATLAPGSWTITAVASLNGQTKSTVDPIPLEVQ